MGTLLGQLLTCCTAENLNGKTFATTPAIPNPPDAVSVISKAYPHIFDPIVGRTHEALMLTAQLGTHLAHAEVQDMPNTGWQVYTSTCSCGCRFFQKYADCIHLVHALSVRGLLRAGKRETLVYRGPNKARRLMGELKASGRPAQSSYAIDKN
ncbi:uncharacterized protein PITG_21340 [Phytophthora infestans T30-4]|uniref:SWIM-type domain-containing protein n=1 Tax=Phytophthora infestans (strain T30-4) TaxID=403677 RepID=D0P3L0_PHYIT|nr:uncharacterized protein PITG_21340 [Phytophthora infestans T30-4]EEY60253.1 hypothetical protein PITG_21340 [Phytophthora infestans T30-4]|eukprot:XP_002895115.1 hypothetical protein PITG_21340 [Phytophthora infestans T30-4]